MCGKNIGPADRIAHHRYVGPIRFAPRERLVTTAAPKANGIKLVGEDIALMLSLEGPIGPDAQGPNAPRDLVIPIGIRRFHQGGIHLDQIAGRVPVILGVAQEGHGVGAVLLGVFRYRRGAGGLIPRH